jgi:hypothetical protein
MCRLNHDVVVRIYMFGYFNVCLHNHKLEATVCLKLVLITKLLPVPNVLSESKLKYFKSVNKCISTSTFALKTGCVVIRNHKVANENT